MPNMSALLSALKRASSSGGMPGDDDEEDLGKPVAAKLSVVHAKPVAKASDAALSDKGMDGMDDEDMPDMGDMSDADDNGGPEEPEGSGDEEAENAYNSRVVDALQDQYPQIFAKITKSLDSEDQSSAPDLSDTTPPVAAMR